MSNNDFIQDTERQVTTYFKVSIESIKDKNNSRQVSNARNFLYYILHVDYKVSFNTLSKMYNRTSRNIQMRISDTKFLVENQKKYQKMYIEIKAV